MENYSQPIDLEEDYLDVLRKEGQLIDDISSDKSNWFSFFLDNAVKGLKTIGPGLAGAAFPIAKLFFTHPPLKPDTAGGIDYFKKKAVELGKKLKTEGKSKDEIEREIEKLAQEMGVELY